MSAPAVSVLAVSFAAPLVLVLLLAIPVLVVLYGAHQRGRLGATDGVITGAAKAAAARRRSRWCAP